jgi:5,10-methylenetetrahydromethanopterin reductase
MRFGIRLIQYHGDARRLVELAALAERCGVDQVWYPHDPFMRHTWALAAATALRTERIGIGSIATNPYTTDPSEIAAFLATLDELSRGRALVGIGLHTTAMVGWTGYDAVDHVERTRWAVRAVRRLLRGETVDEPPWSDQCYLRFEPPRRQVPIYIAAFGPEYLTLSGEIGDGSMPMVTPPESAPLMVAAVRAGAPAREFDIAGCVWLSLSEDGRAARERLRTMIAYFGPYLEERALATAGLSRADFAPIKALVDAGRYDEAASAVSDDMLRLAIAGTPEDVVAAIERLAAAGITQANLGGPLGPDAEEALRLLGERVIPHFR